MNLSKFATAHIKPILFITIILCGIGAWSIGSFPVSILPDITFPRVIVIAQTGDLPTKMMEISVARPLEESIATVPDVTRIRSKIQRGSVETSIDLSWGADVLTTEQLINNRINEVRPKLAAGTEIQVHRMNPTVFPIYGISLRARGLSQTELWNYATYTMRPLLSRVPGVARVVVQGGRIPEVAVDVNPQRLAAFHLSLQEVNQAIGKTNVIRTVGLLNRRFQQNQTMVSGEITDPNQLKNVVVAERNGAPILLSEVATIYPSKQDRTTYVTANGQESVLLNIVRQPSANTISVVMAVRQELDKLKSTLPPGASINTFYDQSILIKEAVGSVRDAVLIGAALAVVVLMLFLGDIRATLVTASIIPATMLITFLFMRLAGLTINLMTLGALAVGVGLVIDDAIVVVENVFRHLSHGETRAGAVQKAAKEIAVPMLASTPSTVVVFLPLSLLVGVAGAFFTALAVTLSIALMVSLSLALLVSPSLCAAFLRTRVGAKEHGPLFEKVVQFYERTLRVSLKNRKLMPIAAAALVGCTLFFGSKLGTGFMPNMDEGAFILDYVTPPGTSLQESNRLLMKIEKILKQTPEVSAFSRRTGAELGFAITEPNRGDFAVMLKSGPRRSIDDVMNDVRQKIEMTVPGVQIDFSEVLQDLIGDLSGAPAPIEIKIFGEHPSITQPLARKIGENLSKITGVVDMKTGVVESGPELVAQVDPIRAGRADLTPDDVATQMNAALFGEIPTFLLQGEKQVGVRVRYPITARDDLQTMQLLPIHSPLGFNLPLSALATIRRVSGSTEMVRENQRRMVDVTAHITGRDLGSVMKDVQKMMKRQNIPPGVSYTLGGQYKSQQDSFTNLLQVLGLAILLVFAIMLFQFGSFTAPSVILLIMPLSLFGVTFGLWITNTPLNVSSFMGAIMLVGIVVKNGILLLDHAQKAEADGTPLDEAVLHAGAVRLRPILMTTLAAVLGLVPLALGLGAGAQMQQPLAIAVIGGLTFSTLFTLIFGPILYYSFRSFQMARKPAHLPIPAVE